MRWYEAIEKAIVIWLRYLGIGVETGRSREHRYHEAVLGRRSREHSFHEGFLESLSYQGNPFFEVFDRHGLVDDLRLDKRLRNNWRHDKLPIQNPFES